MKKTAALLFAILLLNVVKAQQQFQGKIVYRLHATMDEKKNEPDAELTAVFAPQKIKLYFKKEGKDDPEAIIINLDSGKIYTVNSDSKKYSEKTLKVKTTAAPVADRTYLGYKTTARFAEDGGVSGVLTNLFGNSEIVLFSSDSLFFNIPEKYSRNAELIIVNKNHIVLGADIKLGAFMNNNEEGADKKDDLITAAAKEITPMAISPAEFAIPTDYVNKKDEVMEVDTSATLDSTTVTVDTTMATPKKVTTKKTTTKKSVPKKTTGNKSSAAMRKP
ncbi:MAG: hypothetical protein ABJA78_06540 [Ferruginibacter sp.]